MTQEELKRLAKIAPESFVRHEVLTAGHQLHWRDDAMVGLDESYDERMFASVVSSLLVPWTAVPCGDKYVLVRANENGTLVTWHSRGRVIQQGRFDSPLHAAEALHGEKE